MEEIKFNDEQKETVIKMIAQYLEIYGNSECIAQGRNAQMKAIEIMCEIADLIIPIN
jgi:hypothetical protein